MTGFTFFGSVFGTTLSATFYSGRIQCATYDVVTYTRQVFYPAATNQHDAVLLEVVTFTRDIGDDLGAVR